MNISELSIRRPVMATVLTIIILLFGVIGYTYLGVREYPSVDNPIISVTCSYPGANADVTDGLQLLLDSQVGDFAQLEQRTFVALDRGLIRADAGRIIRLSDIGRAELGPQDTRSYMKMNGVPTGRHRRHPPRRAPTTSTSPTRFTAAWKPCARTFPKTW